jgi:hypothetical protein
VGRYTILGGCGGSSRILATRYQLIGRKANVATATIYVTHDLLNNTVVHMTRLYLKPG